MKLLGIVCDMGCDVVILRRGGFRNDVIRNELRVKSVLKKIITSLEGSNKPVVAMSRDRFLADQCAVHTTRKKSYRKTKKATERTLKPE